jgi:SAM-dependent methyltransferase
MIDYLDVPREFNRNAPEVAAAGPENTGETLIKLAAQSAGYENLQNVDVLDVGCGVRFTATIINRKIPVKSYTGVEVYRPIIDFLKDKVERYDNRFKYEYWNVHNEMYNRDGSELAAMEELPVDGTFDLIWLFSVFTHLNPEDSLALLKLLRKKARKGGKLFFSVFIDEDLDGFDDRIKERPLEQAYYGRKYMQSIIEQSGWRIELFHDKDLSNYIQHYIVCSPD